MEKCTWYQQLKNGDEHLDSLHIMPFRKLTEQQWIDVISLLTHHPTIGEFYASGHYFTDEMIKLLARVLSERARENRPFKRVCFGTSPLNMDAFVESIPDGIDSVLVDTLDLTNKGLTSLDAVAKIKCNKLILARNPSPNVSQLASMGELEFLDLSASEIGNDLSLLNARELVLFENDLNAKAAQSLAPSYRNLSFCPPFDERSTFPAGLMANSECTDLMLKKCHFADHIVDFSAWTSLRNLALIDCDLHDEMTFVFPSSLVKLDVSINRLSEVFLQVADVAAVKDVNLHGNQVKKISKLDNICVLDVSCNPVEKYSGGKLALESLCVGGIENNVVLL